MPWRRFGGVALLFSSTLYVHAALAWPGGDLWLAPLASLGTVLAMGSAPDPFGATAAGCAIGAALPPAASLFRELTALPATFAAAWPLAYLTVAGSLGAYVMMSWLISHWSVTRTAYITVIVPVIALALGALVAATRVPGAPSSLGGAALVLAGLLLGMRPERSS